jgi:hypothetical protein
MVPVFEDNKDKFKYDGKIPLVQPEKRCKWRGPSPDGIMVCTEKTFTKTEMDSLIRYRRIDWEPVKDTPCPT